MALSLRNGGNRGIAGAAGDRPHTVQYYVHFPFAILSQRIHRLLNRGQIRLFVLRKEVNIGIFAVPDHLFDDGAQQAAFFLQRSRRRFSSSVAESIALAKDSIIS